MRIVLVVCLLSVLFVGCAVTPMKAKDPDVSVRVPVNLTTPAEIQRAGE